MPRIEDARSRDPQKHDAEPLFIGWLLDAADRRRLIKAFPPHFSTVVADHVTLCREDAPEGAALYDDVGQVVGHLHDPTGVEALIVDIGGTTDRPDGGVFHLTWSLDRDNGRKAFHSNASIARHGWRRIASSIEIRLHAASWPASRYA